MMLQIGHDPRTQKVSDKMLSYNSKQECRVVVTRAHLIICLVKT
jgi:hypothetical protein